MKPYFSSRQCPPSPPGGGYSSLLSPTQRRRFSYSESGRNSVSASSRVLNAYNPMGGSFGIDDYFAESDDGDEADDEFDQMTISQQQQHQQRNAHQQQYDQLQRHPSIDSQSDRTPVLLLSVPTATVRLFCFFLILTCFGKLLQLNPISQQQRNKWLLD